MARHLDFDAWRAEVDAEPLTFTLAGRTWELPASMPAGAVIAAADITAQLAVEHGPDVDIDQLPMTPSMASTIARAAFPAGMLDQLTEAGLSAEELIALITWAMGEWQEAGRARAGDGQGEAGAPNGAAPSGPNGSSATGTPSKPTPPGSSAPAPPASSTTS